MTDSPITWTLQHRARLERAEAAVENARSAYLDGNWDALERALNIDTLDRPDDKLVRVHDQGPSRRH